MTEPLHVQQPQGDPLVSELLKRRAEFLGFLSARTGNASLAEDILQSAYVKAVEKSTQIQKAESVVAWFYRILRNALTDHYRSTAAHDRAHEQFMSEAPISYEPELTANVCACVSGVLQTLKDEYRTALERVDLGGETVAEFAQAQGTTANSASVRLHRARKAAAKRLTQVCGACAEHKCLDCTCKKRV